MTQLSEALRSSSSSSSGGDGPSEPEVRSAGSCKALRTQGGTAALRYAQLDGCTL